MKKLLLASLFAVLFLNTASKAQATNTTIYDSTPSVVPSTSYPSQPFQAQQTFEFGDYIHLAGTDRLLSKVTVTMVTWAKFADYASNSLYSGNTTNWTHPITLNIYANTLTNGIPNNKLGTITTNIDIPWRPAASPNCTELRWMDESGKCNNGFAFNAEFDLSSLNLTLPNDVIVSVAYNTNTWGYEPINLPGPYESLNVAVPANQVVGVGTDDSVSEVFWNTATASNYTDGGVRGVNVFRKDTNWTPNGTVALKLEAKTKDILPPSTPVITGFTDPTLVCGATTNSHLATVNWTQSQDDQGLAGYEYYVDYPLPDGTRGVWNPSDLWTNTFNAGSLNEGVHHIKVRAKDLAGNYSKWSNECDIAADWTAPVVNFHGFKDQSSNTYDSSTITKSCGSINNSGFISWEWQLANLESNPVSYLYTILTGPTAVGYSASTSQTHYNGQIPVVGNYTVSVVASDIAGNQSAPATCVVNYQLAQTWLTPTKESDCKKSGWKIFNKPAFKNQGLCEKFVEQLKKDDKDKDHKDEKNDKDDDHKDDSKLKRVMENLVLHRD